MHFNGSTVSVDTSFKLLYPPPHQSVHEPPDAGGGAPDGGLLAAESIRPVRAGPAAGPEV